MPSLDGWRALAILLVLLQHWPASRGGMFLLEQHPFVFEQGNFGVRMFFVISGFIITWLLLGEQARTGGISLKRFWVRRAIRILPVYSAYVFLLLVLQLIGSYHDTLSSWLGVFTFTRNVLGVGSTATAHLWSLSVEEQFYLIFPAIAVGLSLLRRPWLAIGLLALASFASVALEFTGCATPGFLCTRLLGGKSIIVYASSLSVGCMLAIALHHGLIRPKNWGSVFWLAALALVVLRSPLGDLGAVNFLRRALEAVLIGICIVHTVTAKPWLVHALLNTKAMTYIGLISYSLYIWHFMFLDYFTQFTFQSALFDWRLWWIPAIAAGVASYHLIERPTRAWRNAYRTA